MMGEGERLVGVAVQSVTQVAERLPVLVLLCSKRPAEAFVLGQGIADTSSNVPHQGVRSCRIKEPIDADGAGIGVEATDNYLALLQGESLQKEAGRYLPS